MIRASVFRARTVRALMASAVFAGALALAGCDTDGVYQLPTRAMKELSPQMLALLDEKHMPKDSPILIRLFKEESELEVWKKDTTGRYELLKVYPICRWSGDLGPKVREGDRQAPEGFYQITPALMNPNSNYYLAINTGFPNAYDKANGRHGAFLMIHGDCSSRGCYAMTDEQIGEIYSLAREALFGGQQSFQIQAYPFHMTPANLAHHRTNPNMAFWRMIKEGNDHFEVTRLEPKVEVCDRHYVFDPQPPANSTKPLTFNPTGRCPAFTVTPEIAGPTAEKQHADEAQYAQLVRNNSPVAPIRTGVDGGANRVFLAQLGSLPPARVAPPDATGRSRPTYRRSRRLPTPATGSARCSVRNRRIRHKSPRPRRARKSAAAAVAGSSRTCSPRRAASRPRQLLIRCRRRPRRKSLRPIRNWPPCIRSRRPNRARTNPARTKLAGESQDGAGQACGGQRSGQEQSAAGCQRHDGIHEQHDQRRSAGRARRQFRQPLGGGPLI